MHSQLQAVAHLANTQRAQRVLPRLDGVRSTRAAIELDFVRQHPGALLECELRIVIAVRFSHEFPHEHPTVACLEGGEHLPSCLKVNEQFSVPSLRQGWLRDYTLQDLVHDICSGLDCPTTVPFCESLTVLPDPQLHSPLQPVPSAPTLRDSDSEKVADLLDIHSSHHLHDLIAVQVKFKCKWFDMHFEFNTQLPRSLGELKSTLVRHMPRLQDCTNMRLAEFNSSRAGSILDNDKQWKRLVASHPTTVFILISTAKVSSPKAATKDVDLLGLHEHDVRPPSPSRAVMRMPPPAAAQAASRTSLDSSHSVRCIVWTELEVGGVIGNGSSCRVYKATWRGTEVAVKVFTATDRAALEKEFTSELTTMSHLGAHPSLVLLLAVTREPVSFVFEFLPFSLFELINGVEDRSRKIPPFPSSWTKRVTMMLDISKGLQFLHSFDIIHRDMKSLNLLVTLEGRVKLADFGISRVAKQNDLMTGCCGTYQWMAPEVLQSLSYSVSADIYSFGVILWEICEAAAPFAGLPPAMVPIAVVRDKKRPQFSSRTPPQLKDLIRSCWQEDPTKRPTAAHMTQALQGFFH